MVKRLDTKAKRSSGKDNTVSGTSHAPALGGVPTIRTHKTGAHRDLHNRRIAHRLHIQTDAKPVIPVIDTHVHLVTFMQTTPGMKTLLRSMDAGNISKSVVFGLSVKKKWESTELAEPTYYLDDNARCYPWPSTDEMVAYEYLKLTAEERKRIAPMLTGFSPTDLSSIDYVEYMFEKYPFWRGVGELLLRHDDLTNLTMDETARANHPALTRIYEFCEKRRLPILIHQNCTSVGIHDRYEYLHEVREPLERHPDALFVWAHCGCSRRIITKDYARMVKGMLQDYPNLHVDLSWVVYEDVICRKRSRPKDGLIPKAQWMEDVVLRFPERITIGSDLVGAFDLHGGTMARYNGLLEEVPGEIRDRIAFSNAERLWFSSPDHGQREEDQVPARV